MVGMGVGRLTVAVGRSAIEAAAFLTRDKS